MNVYIIKIFCNFTTNNSTYFVSIYIRNCLSKGKKTTQDIIFFNFLTDYFLFLHYVYVKNTLLPQVLQKRFVTMTPTYASMTQHKITKINTPDFLCVQERTSHVRNLKLCQIFYYIPTLIRIRVSLMTCITIIINFVILFQTPLRSSYDYIIKSIFVTKCNNVTYFSYLHIQDF